MISENTFFRWNILLNDLLAKDYNRGFGIIRHKSPKVAANDLYTYDSKLFLRTIDNF